MNVYVAAGILACFLSVEGTPTLRAQPQREDVKPLPKDTLNKPDTLWEDTLRAVTIRPLGMVPLSKRMQKYAEEIKKGQRYSLNGIIEKLSPTLHDQIMHPFGFKERRKSRKRKKVRKVLQQYDALPMKDPLQLLLDSVAREMTPPH